MATRKTKTQEKKYVVLYEDAEVWVVGTKKDISTDFNKDPELYVKEAKNIKIYDLGELLSFKFITPQIVL